MKYYAVTEDPNELYHYGVKGMKWGQHIFGEKPRSPGYKKAASKLRASLKNGIKNTQAHWAQSKELRSIRKERQAENLANRRLNEALGAQAMKQARKEQRAARAEMRKEASAERREQRQMQRYLEKARKGTLKYKKISNDQIGAIAERLNLENQARRLSGNEQPSMFTRIRRSIGEGVVRGVGSAVAVGIEENARARARYKSQKKYGVKMAKQDAKAQRAKDKQRATYAKEEAEEAQDRKYYEMLAETGRKANQNEKRGRNARVNRQNRLNEYNKRKEEDDFNKDLRESMIRAYAKRGDKEQGEQYIARLKKNDWRAEMADLAPNRGEAFTESRFGTRRLSQVERRQRAATDDNNQRRYKDIETLTVRKYPMNAAPKVSQSNSAYRNLYPQSRVTWSSARKDNDKTSRKRRSQEKWLY